MRKRPERRADVADVDCTDTQALVTGSTSGVGRAAALALGRLGADVVVHGRDAEAGAAVVDELADAGRSESTLTLSTLLSIVANSE